MDLCSSNLYYSMINFCFISSFFSLDAFYFFLSPTYSSQALLYITVLNVSGKVGFACLVPGFIGESFSLSPLSTIPVGILQIVEEVPFFFGVFKNRFYILEWFQVHRKIEQKVHRLPIYCSPHMHSLPSPSVIILHHSHTFVRIDEPTLTSHCHPEPIVGIIFHSWCCAFQGF